MFSPCYNFEHLTDSFSSQPITTARALNLCGYIPGLSAVVGTYRIATGIIDIIIGIANAIFINFSEGFGISATGFCNVVRGSFECSHFVLACGLKLKTREDLMLAIGLIGLITGLALKIYDSIYQSSFKMDGELKKKYDMMLYYDSTPAYATLPTYLPSSKFHSTFPERINTDDARKELLTKGIKLAGADFS